MKSVPHWESGMNPEQIETIRHTEGPVAVLATAGSGKTRALVHRVARMVADGVDPKSILAVTFSKKAGGEMNSRLKQLNVEETRIGTWHSLCLQILREDNTKWSDWSIDDTDRFPLLVKEAMGYKYMDWKTGDLASVVSYIGLCKANLELATSDEALLRADQLFPRYANLAYGVYAVAQQLCEAKKLLTFDDFLVNAWQHLQNESTRLDWSSRFNFLLQDEAQDSNVAQREIAKALAKDHRNYMIVADPGQSIYGFRGSQPSFVLSFEKEWNAKLIIMNRNYRSSTKIVQVANDIIRSGALRLPTDMCAEREAIGNVRVNGFSSIDDESRELVTWIESLTQTEGAKISDFAVLYRTNAQSRPFEEALLKAKIPYVVIGGVSFYDRREVKNLLAYLRVAAGRADSKDIHRCINAPFRFLGNAFVSRIMSIAETMPKPINWTKLVRNIAVSDGIQDRQRSSAIAWADLIEFAYKNIDTSVFGVLKYIVEKTKYIEWLRKDEGGETTENSHAENISELLSFSTRYNSVNELLDYIDQVKEAARKNKESKHGNRVVLMSIHRSKGLEWPFVFLAGVNERILPHKKGDIEEERRLMYVAVTRARDGLNLSYSNSCPSRFLLDAGLIQSDK